MDPIDIIANAIRAADGNHTMGAGQLAEVAAEALTDLAIVANAVQALRVEGFGSGLSDAELADAATVVLRSVAGGA